MAALALRYRPLDFEDLVGQLHAAQSLKNAIDYGKIHHAYLFFGSRGVGKTTTARILARCLNCEKGPTTKPCGICSECQAISAGYSQDVVEMDAASNRGIENIRNLRENARFSPMRGKYKIYIIDEVHMLSTEAFNALLKTLEEPPEHVVFILATTELQKVPETIVSRCQTYTFRKFSIEEIVGRLKYVLQKEGISFEEEALYLVAERAEGSMRDALSLLDQLIAFCGEESLNADKARVVFGIARSESSLGFVEALVKKDLSRQLKLIYEVYHEGLNLKRFLWETLSMLKDMVLAAWEVSNYERKKQNPEFARLVQEIDKQELLAVFSHLYKLYDHWGFYQLNKSNEIRLSLEMALVELHAKLQAPSISNILVRLNSLARAIETGREYKEEKPQSSSPQETDLSHLIAREFLAEEKPLSSKERLFP
ncbi:MAG: DNA polymerase III subunit gamma/tau [Leptospiraceae bacterium]|nr:DNA polymerase III subunit gamma/tau [Leptospiraceae bacterium]MDW8306982.1 DNA polymerase III subunit gamma/tau [Leptospiraceae bacterium]